MPERSGAQVRLQVWVPSQYLANARHASALLERALDSHLVRAGLLALPELDERTLERVILLAAQRPGRLEGTA